MNRPERLNAMTNPMMESMAEVLADLANDSSVRAVILAGEGRAFCAGGDVSAMGGSDGKVTGGGTPIDEQVKHQRQIHRSSHLLHTMGKPTVAVVQGAAVGAGLSLALACDLRVGGESARMGTAFARVGLAGDFGGTYFLTKIVGPAKARELYFSAEILNAQQCLELGLLTKVVADADLRAAGNEFAQRLASGPSVAFAYMKRNLNLAMHSDAQTVLDSEAELHRKTGLTQDHAEAAKAFVEKREPVFHGR
ncbi:MAG: enoyl-CoA hydratase [Dehalococcoidia bacterium]|nr:enoyl-CoA hydratase [Dehalococcoidia bacterium]